MGERARWKKYEERHRHGLQLVFRDGGKRDPHREVGDDEDKRDVGLDHVNPAHRFSRAVLPQEDRMKCFAAFYLALRGLSVLLLSFLAWFGGLE